MTRALDPHLPTGAHALGALPEDERAEFEAHLSGCRDCSAEVAGLRETAARLGSAAAQAAPSALRPQVLQAIRFARQVPAVSEIVTVFSRGQGFRRAAALFSAACVAAAVVAGTHGALSTSTVKPVAGRPHTHVGDLLAAPDLRLVTARDAKGTAVTSSSRDEMLVLADGLRALPRDRVYQLWLVDGHGPRSAGTARPAGEVLSLLTSGIEGVGEALLTVEPAGGSPGPTSSPVLTFVLH
ncbi:anti-sigma factor [Lentzea cavernae]|nr:anti-sigma factor [Lentzea cavernae]